jgi:hypothetical protein
MPMPLLRFFKPFLESWNRRQKRQQRKDNHQTNFKLVEAGETPILVYQMGKVGSSSIRATLRRNEIRPIFQYHRMNPQNIQTYVEGRGGKQKIHEEVGLKLNELIVKPKRRAKVITMVREPVARNVSDFFERFGFFTGKRKDSTIQTDELAQLHRIFLEEYPHDEPLIWFDIEMKTMLGVDVFEHPFDKEKGYVRFQHKNYDVLVIKLETPDEIKAQALSEFLGRDTLDVSIARAAETRVYADLYDQFKKTLILPPASQLVTHFYTPAEVEKFRAKWEG